MSDQKGRFRRDNEQSLFREENNDWLVVQSPWLFDTRAINFGTMVAVFSVEGGGRELNLDGNREDSHCVKTMQHGLSPHSGQL